MHCMALVITVVHDMCNGRAYGYHNTYTQLKPMHCQVFVVCGAGSAGSGVLLTIRNAIIRR